MAGLEVKRIAGLQRIGIRIRIGTRISGIKAKTGNNGQRFF